MTSPNLAPDGLPYVEAGMIWDGVTVYHNGRPSGVSTVRILRMYGDGTRRFTESVGTSRPMDQLGHRADDGWEPIGIAIEGLRSSWRTDFLNYDGLFSSEPVNQIFYTNTFRAHAARYAQHLNATLNFDVLKSADEWKRLTVKQTLSAMLGIAAKRYDKWDEDDPEERIAGPGAYAGTLLWKRFEQDYIDTHEALCGHCKLDLYAQEFFFDADLAAFRDLGRQGIVYVPDHSTTPWSPTLFGSVNQTVQTVGEFYNDLDTRYLQLIRYYAQVVAKLDRVEHR